MSCFTASQWTHNQRTALIQEPISPVRLEIGDSRVNTLAPWLAVRILLSFDIAQVVRTCSHADAQLLDHKLESSRTSSTSRRHWAERRCSSRPLSSRGSVRTGSATGTRTRSHNTAQLILVFWQQYLMASRVLSQSESSSTITPL